jgi:hypothetical protein
MQGGYLFPGYKSATTFKPLIKHLTALHLQPLSNRTLAACQP